MIEPLPDGLATASMREEEPGQYNVWDDDSLSKKQQEKILMSGDDSLNKLPPGSFYSCWSTTTPEEIEEDYVAIRDRLLAAQQEAEECQRRLDGMKAGAKQGLVADLLEEIDAHGFDRQEILSMCLRKAKVKAPKKPQARVEWTDKAVPGSVYIMGAFPGWMKERMGIVGVDPARAEDRKVYRDTYLQKK
jgi:hypothetical protein